MRELMTSGEVAKYLGVCQRQVSERLRFQPGFPKAVRLIDGGLLRWDKAEIAAWLETRREAA